MNDFDRDHIVGLLATIEGILLDEDVGTTGVVLAEMLSLWITRQYPEKAGARDALLHEHVDVVRELMAIHATRGPWRPEAPR